MNDPMSKDVDPIIERQREIFFKALEQPSPAERARYLEAVCGDDKALRAEVELLLKHQSDSSFLERPAVESSGTISTASVSSEAPGAMIGRYKLLEKIGEGGCGIVYMAEQEEPVRRKVALKVIKLGMDTRSVIARFEAERQALARMDHPNIAKVLDAGATETGRPYFVMELVGGIKITDYCEQNKLDTRHRLDLFMQVCRAIQHAHQKGIIHRDIKPSNVLVATQDGVAIPKVIDFGIAKATQGKLTDQTAFTAFEQFLGTPAYMSPEQAQLGGLDVDTRSDIYSLGVLLYELLTGRTPFDAKDLLAVGIETMRRTICEKEPPTPSTRLKLDLAAQQAQGPSGSKIKNQKPRIANDLDWIVMKCLEKDRSRRYETANDLAFDIQRHLNNEPVVARPPSNLYRLQKLVHRNKLLFAATSAVSLALVLGLGLSTWMFFRERAGRREQARLRQEAQTEAAKSQQVARFLKEMLEDVGPSKALGRDTTMLKEILDNAAQRIGRDLTNQPWVEIELRGILAFTYRELGLYKQMENMSAELLRITRATAGEESSDTANALYLVGSSQFVLGNYAQAEATLQQALALQRRLLGNEHLNVAITLNHLADVFRQLGKLPQAETASREALAITRKVAGNDHPEVATALNSLGNVLHAENKLTEAESVLREAVALCRKLFGNNHPDVAAHLHNLAGVLEDQGNLPAAEAIYREVLEMQRKLLGNEHPRVAFSLDGLGDVLGSMGRPDEAITNYTTALIIFRKCLGNEHPVVATVLDKLASALQERDKLGEAEPLSREALEMRRKLLGNEHEDVTLSVNSLSAILRQEGKLSEAEKLCSERLVELRARPEFQDPHMVTLLASLGRTRLMAGKFTEAEDPVRECLGIREKSLPDDWRTLATRSLLGDVLLGQKRYTEAEPLLVAAYEGMNQRQADIRIQNKRFLKEALLSLVQLCEATSRTNEATVWKQKIEEFDRAQTNGVASSTQPKPSL
jgi:serine/threonine protein kinase/tetratricopeptide (TPR) repeat protein